MPGCEFQIKISDPPGGASASKIERPFIPLGQRPDAFWIRCCTPLSPVILVSAVFFLLRGDHICIFLIFTRYICELDFCIVFYVVDDLFLFRRRHSKSWRNISRGNSLSDALDLASVLGDTRAYLYSPVWG